MRPKRQCRCFLRTDIFPPREQDGTAIRSCGIYFKGLDFSRIVSVDGGNSPIAANARLHETNVGGTLPSAFRSTFLDGFTPRQIKVLLKSARQEKISAHQVLQREGDSASRLWLLVTGLVVVYRLAQDGNNVFVSWGVPGDVFGLATVLRQPARYIVTIEAVQEGSMYAWDLARCSDLLLRYASISRAANSVAAGYLGKVIDVLTTRAFRNSQQRLALVLIESARQIGRTGREGVELDLTNEQLAVAAHMSLFTATRNLSKWQELGILKKYRGKIVLPSLAHFEMFTKCI